MLDRLGQKEREVYREEQAKNVIFYKLIIM
jgi:hypothetical protein